VALCRLTILRIGYEQILVSGGLIHCSPQKAVFDRIDMFFKRDFQR
jgi:hypothetical protein